MGAIQTSHSAVTWLESAPWVTVFSFARPALKRNAQTSGSWSDYADSLRKTHDPSAITTTEQLFLQERYPERFYYLQIGISELQTEVENLVRDFAVPSCVDHLCNFRCKL